ncbi:MAG: PIG-L family deacetylase [Actinomycetota bacterium]|nr:PIG-L family deacetylase [Actinomycetota bacterium]MDQ3680654.1 PIG-L family deacetylase [Actinomycetota bacterium]
MPADREVTRALVVAAHPDDVDFGAAGTVAAWTDAGVAVTYCIVTDGDAGGFDPEVPRSQIPTIRRAEQEAAAEVVGVSDVVFLGYPDGRLQATIELRRDIARVIRRVRPERVLCPSPERNWQRIYPSHPDHLAAGEAALCAVYPDARNAFAHPELAVEGYEPWSVPEVWVMAGPHEPNRFTDITVVFERKLAALGCHQSQITDPATLESNLRGWFSGVAGLAGLPDGSLAEGFFVIDTA